MRVPLLSIDLNLTRLASNDASHPLPRGEESALLLTSARPCAPRRSCRPSSCAPAAPSLRSWITRLTSTSTPGFHQRLGDVAHHPAFCLSVRGSHAHAVISGILGLSLCSFSRHVGLSHCVIFYSSYQDVMATSTLPHAARDAHPWRRQIALRHPGLLGHRFRYSDIVMVVMSARRNRPQWCRHDDVVHPRGLARSILRVTLPIRSPRLRILTDCPCSSDCRGLVTGANVFLAVQPSAFSNPRHDPCRKPLQRPGRPTVSSLPIVSTARSRADGNPVAKRSSGAWLQEPSYRPTAAD